MLKLRGKKRIRNFFLFTGFVPTGWAPCCKTWLKFEVKIANVGDRKKMIACYGEKKMMKDFFSQSIFRVGVCALHTLGRHVVNETKVA